MNDIVTYVSVPRDHPSLPGHFPGRPIVPGVVLLDLTFAALCTALAQPIELVSIVSAKFMQAVAPETRVDVHIKITPDEREGFLKARFALSCAQAPVVEGSFMLATKERA
jgi:3-hydroxymyristoyl/3-hydroxydecanoyl-(acyl carrier protein) dehydratase